MYKQGFSLFEFLIVLFIFSILLSFVYPSYQNYLIRSHRLEGQLAVLDLANRMEQYFMQNHTYAHASIGAGNVHDVLTTALTQHGYYALRIYSANDQHFIVQAVPQETRGQVDLFCQTLQMDDLGVQTIVSGPSGSPIGKWDECWG